MRIGIPSTYFYEDLDPEVHTVSYRAIENLRRAGFQLIENDGILPGVLAEVNHKASFDVVYYEILDRL